MLFRGKESALPRTEENERNKTPVAKRFFSSYFNLRIRTYQSLRVSFSAPLRANESCSFLEVWQMAVFATTNLLLRSS